MKETRPTVIYRAVLPEAEPHKKGCGNEDVVVLFSLRPYLETKSIYETFEDDHQIVPLMTFDDLNALYYCMS